MKKRKWVKVRVEWWVSWAILYITLGAHAQRGYIMGLTVCVSVTALCGEGSSAAGIGSTTLLTTVSALLFAVYTAFM